MTGRASPPSSESHQTCALPERDDRKKTDFPSPEKAGLESPAGGGPVAAFAELAARRGIPLDIARELLAGVASDIGGVRVASVAELLRYAYRVASTVGLMVCHILDVRDPNTGFTAMQRMTGYPAAMVVEALAAGVATPGAAPLEKALPPTPLVEGLKLRGIRVAESWL